MSAPTTADPRTGETVTLGDISARMVQTMDELDRSAGELESKVRELGLVTFEFDVQYNASVSTSDAKSEDRRKAEAFAHCNKVQRQNGEPLARAKSRLEIQVRALRDGQHNLRAMLSGWQTVSANLRAEITGLGGRT